MAVVQAFNRERAFQREFDGLNEANRVANVHAQKLSSVFFPGDRVARRRRDRRRPLRRRKADRRRLARDRHADRGDRHAAARLPAAAGALRALRPGAGGERRDGARSRPSSTPSRTSPTGRARGRDRPHRRPPASSTTSSFAYGDEPVIHGISIDVPGGRLHRARRRVGRRQVDDREADRALLRPARGRGPRRRHRPARRAAALVPPPARRRAAGSVPVQRHDRRQHPLRAARGDRRGGRGGGAARSASTGSPRGSRAGSTTSCARAAPGSRPASGS